MVPSAFVREPIPVSTGRKVMYSALVCAAFFAVAEGATRLLWHPPVREGELIPDKAQLWTMPSEGFVTLAGIPNRINSRGFRGPEFEDRPAPCTARMLVVGDSSVYGHGAPDGWAFAELAPTLLSREQTRGLAVEVINGAVPGYSTYQTIMRLDLYGWALEPDLLVIGNLWSDHTRVAAPDREFYEAPVTPPAAWTAAATVLRHSALFRLATRQIVSPRYIYFEGSPDARVYRVSPDEYAANLDHMISEAEARRIQVILVVMPHSEDMLRMMDDWHAQSAAARVEFAADHRAALRAVAARHDVPLVDFSIPFAETAHSLFIDGVHPTVEGHAIMARHLADTLAGAPALFDGAVQRCDEPIFSGAAAEPPPPPIPATPEPPEPIGDW